MDVDEDYLSRPGTIVCLISMEEVDMDNVDVVVLDFDENIVFKTNFKFNMSLMDTSVLDEPVIP